MIEKSYRIDRLFSLFLYSATAYLRLAYRELGRVMMAAIGSVAAADTGSDILNAVDLHRYPIHRRGSPEYKTMVETARKGLGTEECAYLPDFVRPDAVAAMQEEAVSYTHPTLPTICSE